MASHSNSLIFRWLARVSLFAIAIFFIFSVVLVLIYRWLPVPVTPLMILRIEQNLVDGHPVALSYRWCPRTEMTDKLQDAVVAGEDWKFFEHSGFDWDAIHKAIQYNRYHRTLNERKAGRVRGASTISQQTAKNVFLWPSRSWIRKGLEAYFTVLIEALWSKDRIMEVYLNVVELGDGVYGVGAASETYFHKPAAKLTSSEAALLAAVLPNPRLFQVAHPSGYTRFRQTMIQRRMPLVSTGD